MPAAASRGSLARFQNYFNLIPDGVLLVYLLNAYFCIAVNGTEDIVEVMGHPAGQGAHSLHFLRKGQLIKQIIPLPFSLPFGGNITDKFYYVAFLFIVIANRVGKDLQPFFTFVRHGAWHFTALENILLQGFFTRA